MNAADCGGSDSGACEEWVREAAMRRLLAGHPEALVAAIDDEGLFVGLPASLGLPPGRQVRARSALDLVSPSSRLQVVAMWERAQKQGAASTAVELALEGDEPRPALVFVFDLRATHGVHVAVLTTEASSAGDLEAVAEIPAPAPRLVRTRKNAVAVIGWVGPELPAMLGWEPEELLGRRAIDFIHEDHHDAVIDGWMEMLSRPGATISLRVRHRHRDGHWVWVQMSNRNLLDDPDAGYVDSEMLDVSEEVEAQEAVRASEQLLRRLAEALPVGVVQVDPDRRVRFANERFCEILGVPYCEDLDAMLGRVTDPARVLEAVEAALDGHDADVDLAVDRHEGIGYCRLSLRALTGPDGRPSGTVGSLSDVTDTVLMQAELQRRATQDALTGCANRTAALSALAEALTATSGNIPTAAIFMDLDGFKAVNDRFGHPAGDRLLTVIGERLRGAVRDGDIVGRVGGDEFLVICPAVHEPAIALSLAERLAAVVALPVDLGEELVAVQASIGVAWTAAPVSAGELIARADAAMYRSKGDRAGRPVLAEDACQP